MSNNLYTPTGNPGAITRGASALIRAEFVLIATAIANSPLISDMVSAITSWVSGVNANGYGLTGLPNAVNPTDAANLQTVQAIVSGGGTPANIPVTSLGAGTSVNGQVIKNVGGALAGGYAVGSQLTEFSNFY